LKLKKKKKHVTAELPIVFGTHHLFRGNSTELEWQTSFAMQCT